MADEHDRLPQWDLNGVFPGLEGAVKAIDELVAVFDDREIAQRPIAPIRPEDIKTFDYVILAFDSVLRQTITLNAYIQSFVTTDSRNAPAQARLSELQGQTLRLKLLGTRLTAWIGSPPITT